MKKKHLVVLFTVIILTKIINAQSLPFQYDYSQFQADSISNLLEIYYELDPGEIIGKQDDTNNNINLHLVFEIKNSSDNQVVWLDTVQNEFQISQLKISDGYNKIVGLNKCILQNGIYHLSIFSIENEKKLEYAKEKIRIKGYNALDPVVSDLQLAKIIKQDTLNMEALFVKNTLSVVPNPTASYTSDVPVLQFYSELYNVENRKLTLSTFIVSSNNKVVYSENELVNTSNKSIVHVDQINLLRYPSGSYTLQLILSDSSKEYAFASQKQFYFYNKYYTVSEINESPKVDLNSSRFAYYSDEECDELFEKSLYLAKKNEIEQYSKLTSVESKREFLFNYWKNRNIGYADSQKSAFDVYMERIDKANKKFRGVRSNGYKSERGRVFVTYGDPDRVEAYPNESNLKPYEVWFYDSIEGGVSFIFGDLNGFGDYDLLHSTKRGEVYDDTWQRRIYIY